MWDMTDDPFEADLSRLFLKPSGEVDAARLKILVLERLEREDRRRRLVITGAVAVGAAIAASAVAASGFGEAAGLVLERLTASLPTTPSFATPMPLPWLIAIFGLGLGGVLATRAARDI